MTVYIGGSLGRHSISLVVFCLVFGFLLGLAGFLSIAFLGGLTESEAAEASSVVPQSMSAADRLDRYRCNLSATKKIVMGGIEDNYDATGDEQAIVNDAFESYSDLVSGLKWRSYDQGGQDKRFVDEFRLPTRTFKGVMAIGLKELSNIRNDHLSIGIQSPELLGKGFSEYVFVAPISELTNHGWKSGDGYYWIELSDLWLKRLQNENEYVDDPKVPNLLTGIQTSDETQFVLVTVVDDTMVDFIGFGLCLEPEEKMGYVFSTSHYVTQKAPDLLGENEIYLSAAVVDGEVCNKGCLSCQEERPVACILDDNRPAPDNLNDAYKTLWSGGEIKFTEAVAGGSFASEDDVDNYCALNFGEDWRHLNIKDGNWKGILIANGIAPDDYFEYWIGIKDQPHFNCWDLRLDYDEPEVE